LIFISRSRHRIRYTFCTFLSLLTQYKLTDLNCTYSDQGTLALSCCKRADIVRLITW